MSECKPLIPFDPVPVSPRHDGWTAQKQVAFIETLAETGCIAEACRRVGMSESSANRLRRRPCGWSFRRAWDAAVDYGLHRLEQAVVARSVKGVARPIFYKGEQVGEWRHYDERLAMFLLRTRRAARYGKWIDRAFAPDPEAEEESAGMLECEIDELAERAPLVDGNPDEDWQGLESPADSRARVEG